MWTWKHSVSLIMVCMIVSTYIYDVRKKPKVKYTLECFDPSGDAVLMCYFTTAVKINQCCARVNEIRSVGGNFSISELRAATQLEIHPHRVPEHMPGEKKLCFSLKIKLNLVKFLKSFVKLKDFFGKFCLFWLKIIMSS